MPLTIGTVYRFDELEKLIINNSETIALMIENTEGYGLAIMHVFMSNFCGDWVSGDGVLFYHDGETHSANNYDEFKLVKVIKFEE